ASVGLVESHREVGGEVSSEQRFFLTSLPCDVVRFAQAVREHWGVENALHWVLDVSFREDDCRIRQGHGAQNMAVLRHMALNLLRRESGHKRGIKTRSKRGGGGGDYLFQGLIRESKRAYPGPCHVPRQKNPFVSHGGPQSKQP